MGIGCRIFLIDDNHSLQRISMVRLDRLIHFDSRERLPQFSGKRVRCTTVFVEVAGRQVLSIRNADYFTLTFDPKGRIDRKEWERGMRFGMELLPSIPDRESSKRVIDARHHFAKRRYEHEFKWKPTRKVEEAIMAAIFKSSVTNL